MSLLLAGESAINRRYYQGDAVEKPRICAERSSRESQSISLGQTESRADNLCNAVQFKGEDNAIINRFYVSC